MNKNTHGAFFNRLISAPMCPHSTIKYGLYTLLHTLRLKPAVSCVCPCGAWSSSRPQWMVPHIRIVRGVLDLIFLSLQAKQTKTVVCTGFKSQTTTPKYMPLHVSNALLYLHCPCAGPAARGALVPGCAIPPAIPPRSRPHRTAYMRCLSARIAIEARPAQ